MAPGDPVAVRVPIDESRIVSLIRPQLDTSALLTPREVEVARLLCVGRNNAEIATAICVSLPTARRHVEHIFAKLGVHRRAEVLARLLNLTPALCLPVMSSAAVLDICRFWTVSFD